MLEATLPDIPSNILFWLDAHCPGADDMPKIYVRRNMPDMDSDIGRLMGSKSAE